MGPSVHTSAYCPFSTPLHPLMNGRSYMWGGEGREEAWGEEGQEVPSLGLTPPLPGWWLGGVGGFLQVLGSPLENQRCGLEWMTSDPTGIDIFSRGAPGTNRWFF